MGLDERDFHCTCPFDDNNIGGPRPEICTKEPCKDAARPAPGNRKIVTVFCQKKLLDQMKSLILPESFFESNQPVICDWLKHNE